MKRRLLIIAFILIVAFGFITNAYAQEYSFGVSREAVDVYWNADGRASIAYTFVFDNRPGAHVIDFVDVGMPNSDFDISTVTAQSNGVDLRVSTSDYQGSGSGFAVDMGSQAIQPGQSGGVYIFVGKVSNVLYPDSSDSNYASAVFAPQYFGSKFVVGETDMTVTFHMPPGVQPDEPRWHSAPSGFPSEPQSGFDGQNNIYYEWHSPNADASAQYTFGASFPKRYVPDSAIVQTSIADLIIGAIVTFLGFVVSFLPCLCFGAIFLGGPILGIVQAKRRKMQYLPPKISIEGHGVKRGLTAVESAILMEQPLDKVLTMMLFGVLKKNAASVVTRDPLVIQPIDPRPENLYDYEKDFLDAFAIKDTRDRQAKLQIGMVALIKNVSEKMRGFSRKETVDYYKNIMEKAWQQVEAAATPEVKSQRFEEALEWTMLDKDYDDHTRRAFTGPMYAPTWWHHYDPTYRPSAAPARPFIPSAPSSTGGQRSLPGADFAASMVTGMQTFSQGVIGNVTSFTEKITGKTNPPPPPSRSSGGRRSGGGCACACACAGCACACAGGGR